LLLAAIAADAPSLDPHQEETFATLQLVAPCYSTLLQIDLYNYPKIIGDVATGWRKIGRVSARGAMILAS